MLQIFSVGAFERRLQYFIYIQSIYGQKHRVDMEEPAEIDLYEVLQISKDASKAEIKKAYHKAALSSHPDKVPESEREEAEVRFKAVGQAYEILYDEQTRAAYDTHGMAAFDTNRGGPGGMGGDVDIDDLLAQMFMGGGMGGMPGMGGMGSMPRQSRKGASEVQEYEVSLEDLYRGKTTKFASTKKIICSTCKGSGGKDRAKPHDCSVCHGKGFNIGARMIDERHFTQERVVCSTCKGEGKIYKTKDKCKRCKGERVVESKKVLELYIPRGSQSGERIILPGEADQQPGQEPGDIVFELSQKPHDVFRRQGADLAAELKVTLSEVLTGFDRVILKHLDGRGIKMSVPQPGGKILRPDQVLKVKGEGMPRKRSEEKGDLYLTVKIQFPEDGFIRDNGTLDSIKSLLPKPISPLAAPDIVDEIDPEFGASLDEFGSSAGADADGDDWADEDEEAPGPQCAAQ